MLIIFSVLSCSYESSVEPDVNEDDGISWEQITGNIAFIKGNILYYLDANAKAVKSLGGINLVTLKWNKTAGKITGIRLINDSTYSLDGIDLTGNYSVINDKLNSKYYDWLPDGRLVTISKADKITIGGEILLDQTFDPVFGLACSPNGEKIVISTDNILENYLLEININSLEQSIIESNYLIHSNRHYNSLISN